MNNLAQKIQEGDAVLIDVRTQEEWDAGHAQGAVLWDIMHYQSDKKLPDLPRDQPLYLYCRSGARSQHATKVLKENGFSDVTNIGGLSDIAALGIEIVTS